MLLQQLHRRRQQLANNGGTTQARVGQLYKIGRLNQGDGGSDPEDWTEFALNENGNSPEELNFLANRRFRVVAKYNGSLSNSDVGDVQITNAVIQDINNDQAFDYKNTIIYFNATTEPSTVYTGGSTDLEDYINQTFTGLPSYEDGETQTTSDEGKWHLVSSASLSDNTFNREIRTVNSPTANTGRLNCPLQYDRIYYAECTGLGVGEVMWIQSGIYTYIPSQDTNDDYERFIISLGQDGNDCGAIDLFIYVLPETSGTVAYPDDTTAPANPLIVGATITDEFADLTWSAVSDSDLSGYNVAYRYRTNSGSSFGSYETVRGTTETKTGIDLDDLDGFGDYQFRVSAIDASRNQSSGTTSSIVTYAASTVVPVVTVVSESVTLTTFNWSIDITLEIGEFYDSTLANNNTPNQLTSPDTFAIYYELDNSTPTTSSNQVPDSWIQYKSTPQNWNIVSPSAQFALFPQSFKYIVVATNSAGTTTTAVRTVT